MQIESASSAPKSASSKCKLSRECKFSALFVWKCKFKSASASLVECKRKCKFGNASRKVQSASCKLQVGKCKPKVQAPGASSGYQLRGQAVCSPGRMRPSAPGHRSRTDIKYTRVYILYRKFSRFQHNFGIVYKIFLSRSYCVHNY